MSHESGEVSAVMLDKFERYVGKHLIDMLQNFNEYGPQGVTLTNYLYTIPELYGKYSEMTPYVRRSLDAIQSGMRSTSSIGGKMQTAVLVKKVIQMQEARISELGQKKEGGGLFGGLFGGGDKNKDQQQQKNGFGGI